MHRLRRCLIVSRLEFAWRIYICTSGRIVAYYPFEKGGGGVFDRSTRAGNTIHPQGRHQRQSTQADVHRLKKKKKKRKREREKERKRDRITGYRVQGKPTRRMRIENDAAQQSRIGRCWKNDDDCQYSW